MIEKWWPELGHKFPLVSLDTHVIMPNHLHGINVINVGADLCVGPVVSRHVDVRIDQDAHIGAPLPAIVKWFKAMTTNTCVRGVKELGWPAFDGKLSQRN